MESLPAEGTYGRFLLPEGTDLMNAIYLDSATFNLLGQWIPPLFGQRHFFSRESIADSQWIPACASMT